MSKGVVRVIAILTVAWAASLAAACSSDASGGDVKVVFPDGVYFPDGGGPAGDVSVADGAEEDSAAEDLVVPADVVGDTGCTPQCENKSCGEDGCGGTCGECPEDYTCDQNFFCVHDICVPECGGKECGQDGCGGTCGQCPSAQYECLDGLCTCSPSCGLKECGGDGCDGSCGECFGGLDCVNGQCVCEPACAGKDCGDDGCGGTCGECLGAQECTPGGTCEGPECLVEGTLSCGDVLEGSNKGLANNYNGYNCGFDASGPEAIYSFDVDESNFVTLTIEHAGSTQIHLYVTYGNCVPEECVANDSSEAFFTAEAGVDYLVIADGYQGLSGDFTLTVDCIPSGDCPEGKIPGCEGQCQWGHWLGDGMCTDAFECPEFNNDEGDCD